MATLEIAGPCATVADLDADPNNNGLRCGGRVFASGKLVRTQKSYAQSFHYPADL
jgi:hypothetical protein